MRLPRSLRFRLTVWSCCSLALVMLLFSALIYGILDHRLLRRQDERILAKAEQVRSILGSPAASPRLTVTQTEIMDHLGPIIVLLQSCDGSHAVYYQSPELRANPSAPTANVLGWEPVPEPRFSTMRYRGRTWRVLSELRAGTSGRPTVIRLMMDLGEIQETLEQLRFAILLLIPAGTLCSALWGYGLTGRALAPVDRITRMARDLEASKLHQRLPHPGVEDEIGRLVDTLNHMIMRLEGSFQAMQRFTADASHELRNPLATMQNTVDVMLEQPRTVAEQRAALESLGEDVGRLRKIVEDLLLLAGADNGRLAMEREPVRLDLLVQELAETYQVLAQERGLALEVEAPSPVALQGDERWLYQLLGNLLDNAFKFTPRGGTVSIQVQAGPEGARLTVGDTGPGIAEDSLERIFDRFYQADGSRTRTPKSGSGLGLAIAAWIVESHGGWIHAGNRAEGGAVFTVAFPG